MGRSSKERNGQFDSAKETFEIIGDYESTLDLFICHLNPSAMRRLAQKLEEATTDYELRRYCERILRIHSTGWTQGIFAYVAAESMVPKGPEWGGGNWDIKTPINMKDIPQWELAGEVMPYIKTSEGAIPSIIANHIGVYLGAIRGRGNVVEVSEKSLVKAYTATSNENKPLTSSELLKKKRSVAGCWLKEKKRRRRRRRRKRGGGSCLLVAGRKRRGRRKRRRRREKRGHGLLVARRRRRERWLAGLKEAKEEKKKKKKKKEEE